MSQDASLKVKSMQKTVDRIGTAKTTMEQDAAVMSLAIEWIEVAILLRGEGYYNGMKAAFTLTRTLPKNPTKKSSAVLKEKLKELETALDKSRDADTHTKAFVAAQDAMLNLVFEYRTKMKTARKKGELERFDAQLGARVKGANPEAWRTRAH